MHFDLLLIKYLSQVGQNVPRKDCDIMELNRWEYKGHLYYEDQDRDDDVVKIIHQVQFPDGQWSFISFSPYRSMSYSTFKKLVDLEFPSGAWDTETVDRWWDAVNDLNGIGHSDLTMILKMATQ
jgi:hypothetical protein